MRADREVALARLDEVHASCREAMGVGSKHFITGEQVHGCDVAVVDSASESRIPRVDGLITADPSVCLGVYVADCCPVFIGDPIRRVIGIVHSGRKGTELGIALVAIQKMQTDFQSDPSDLVVQLGPCIRPPHYEMDFASQIVEQCRKAGVVSIDDCAVCTACHPDRYYSYRMEMGKTGRMLGLFSLDPQTAG